MSYEEIRKRFNFKELNVATWRNPYESVHPARGGPGLLTTISPADAAKPYIPTYKYQIQPPPKLPEPTDDEDSGSEDEQDEDDDGSIDDQPTVEAAAAQPEVDLAALLQQPPAIAADESTPADEPVAAPVSAEKPPDVTSSTKEVEPVIEAEVPPAPTIEDIPGDSLLTTDNGSTKTDEESAPPDAPMAEEEPAEHNMALKTDQTDGPSSPAEEAPHPQPATEMEESEEIATPELPDALLPDELPGDDATFEVPPHAPEPPIDLDVDIPPPPSGSLDDIMAALGLAPAEMVDILDIPPPPAPEPPPSTDVELPATNASEDIANGATGDRGDHPDKKVSFAPGTPEPKPTQRKKKSATGSKKKKKRSTPAESEGHPDDIVGIIDESEQPKADLPLPDEEIRGVDIVAVVQETSPATDVGVSEAKDVSPEPQDHSTAASDVVDISSTQAAIAAPAEPAAPPSKHSSKKPAKTSSKDKNTKKKSSRSKGKKVASEQPPAGLGIEIVPDVIADTMAVDDIPSTSDIREVVETVAAAPALVETIVTDDELRLAADVPTKPEVQEGQTATFVAATEQNLLLEDSPPLLGDTIQQSSSEAEDTSEAPMSAPDMVEDMDEQAGSEPPAEEVTYNPDTAQDDDDGSIEKAQVDDIVDAAEEAPEQDVVEDELEAPTLDFDKNELQTTGSHEIDAAAPSLGESDGAGVEDVEDSAGGTQHYSGSSASSEVSSMGPDTNFVGSGDDLIEDGDTAEVEDEPADREDVSSDSTSQEPGLADPEDRLEDATATTPDDSDLLEGPAESVADHEFPPDDKISLAEAGHASEDHDTVDNPGLDTNEPATKVAEENVSTEVDSDTDAEKEDAAAEKDVNATVTVDAPAEGVVDVASTPDDIDVLSAPEGTDVAEKTVGTEVKDEAQATETPDEPEEVLPPAEDEDADATEGITDDHLVDSETPLGLGPGPIEKVADLESAVQDDAPEAVEDDALEAATAFDTPEPCEDRDAASLGDGEAVMANAEEEKSQEPEPGNTTIELADDLSPNEAAEGVETENSALPAAKEDAPESEQKLGIEESSPEAIASEGSGPAVADDTVDTVDEAPAVPDEIAATPGPELSADTPEDATANESYEPPAVVADELDIADAEQPGEDATAVEQMEETPARLVDGELEAKEEAVIEDIPESDIAEQVPPGPPSNPAPNDPEAADDPGAKAEVGADEVPEPGSQNASEEVPVTSDGIELITDQQIDETNKAPEASPEAPPSPTVSKDSARRRKDDRGHYSKKSSGDTRSGDKRDSRAGASDPRNRTDRHRSRRLSRAAEEESERKNRRDARAAEKAEEAARLAAQARKKADEEAERQIRHEARRAAKKAAVKEAEEVARRIAREEAEAEAKLAAEARRRRRERRDSAIERERPRVRDRDYERDRDREKDIQRRSERPRGTSTRYDDSKPARPPLLKAFTMGTGESSTRAGLLIRTSSDGRMARGEGSKRSSGRESKPRDSPVFEDKIPRSERKEGSELGSHHSRRSGGDAKLSSEPRTAGKEPPRAGSKDPELKRASTDRPHRRRRESTITDERERERERPHRSRRESERRERRPTLEDKSKEKKSSFMGSLLKAFR